MPRLRNVLVANRGEIAARVIRSARALGYRTTAVYSEADGDAPHVSLADTAVLLGAAPLAESYLNVARILDAARAAKADAIHPGYGLLSENASFARACIEAGLSWIGPPPQAIERLGNKHSARQLAGKLGLPLVPGYDGDDQSDARLIEEARTIGVPVMVKAAAGGGGRGMRRVQSLDALPEALARARSESKAAFGDERLILERAVDGARHVEVQVVADAHGNVIHLGERECSVQRRFQKLIEEAPSPAVDAALRARLGEAAVRVARAAGYVGVGTVELLLAPDGDWYFLEVNTRLQVEHPVTELVTGLDLVALQLRIAEGEPLPLGQADVTLHGHAIEARVCAEDPAHEHMPCTGRVLALELPVCTNETGVRIDHGLCEGLAIGTRYDSLLAKVIAHGDDREQARARLLSALATLQVAGVQTNQVFLQAVLGDERFASATITTDTVDAGAVELPPPHAQLPIAGTLAAMARELTGRVPQELLGFTNATGLNFPIALELEREGARIELTVEASREASVVWVRSGGERVRVHLIEHSPRTTLATIAGVRQRLSHTWDGDVCWLHAFGRMHRARDVTRAPKAQAASETSGRAVAPMDGAVLELSVKAGQVVSAGQTLAVIEAMKLERRVCAEVSGVVLTVHVTAGAHVRAGELLVTVEAG